MRVCMRHGHSGPGAAAGVFRLSGVHAHALQVKCHAEGGAHAGCI